MSRTAVRTIGAVLLASLAGTAPLIAQAPLPSSSSSSSQQQQQQPQSPAPNRNRGQTASFMAGASLGDGETALALSAGLGFELSAHLGLEFELAYARKLDFTLDLCPPPAVCVRGGQLPVTGRTVSLVPHLRFDLLPDTDRLRAYVLAGVGAAHVRQRYFDRPLTPGDPMPPELTRSNLTLAFSFGGGLGAQISRRFGVGLDVRSLHLRDDEATPERFIVPAGTLSTLRIGSRVSWQF